MELGKVDYWALGASADATVLIKDVKGVNFLPNFAEKGVFTSIVVGGPKFAIFADVYFVLPQHALQENVHVSR